MKILSLFDGMSVAQQAISELYKDYTYYASEIDEYAIAVTQSNFPGTRQVGNIKELRTYVGAFTGQRMFASPTIDSKNMLATYHTAHNIDLLIGGSPCQDLSIAKKDRKGLEGEKSSLFYEYVRILNEIKPEYFILENVASMSKESKDKISEILGVQPVMINASLVSAQNRKRLFWVGKLVGDKYEQVEISQPEDRGIMLKDILENGETDRLKSYCIDANYWKGTNWEQYKKKGRRQMVCNYIQYDKNNKGNKSQDQRIYFIDGKMATLPSNGTESKIKIFPSSTSHTVRKLTPTECLRLQSMPDNYFDKATYKGKPVSNSQRYKMCGNAFNKEVVKHIIKHLK